MCGDRVGKDAPKLGADFYLLLENQSFSARRRKAFAITETELSDMASAAMIGLSSRPKVG